jgi:hypothetical protein
MFRTRDYALILATITFLVVGIAATLFAQSSFSGLGGMTASVFESTPEIESYEVVVAEKSELDREGRVASLRAKIARLGLAKEEAPAPEDEEVASVLPEVTEEESDAIAEKRCSYYGTHLATWNPRGLIIEEVEGARLVYRAVEEAAPAASSTAPAGTKDIVLQLPVRSVPMPTEHCIPSDVIGIATDGSLIRNSEVSVYSIFGAGTLVGYALDGFPIYGSDDSASDICGGMMVGGQYRYHINPERETIVACFAGVPVSL